MLLKREVLGARCECVIDDVMMMWLMVWLMWLMMWLMWLMDWLIDGVMGCDWWCDWWCDWCDWCDWWCDVDVVIDVIGVIDGVIDVWLMWIGVMIDVWLMWMWWLMWLMWLMGDCCGGWRRCQGARSLEDIAIGWLLVGCWFRCWRGCLCCFVKLPGYEDLVVVGWFGDVWLIDVIDDDVLMVWLVVLLLGDCDVIDGVIDDRWLDDWWCSIVMWSRCGVMCVVIDGVMDFVVERRAV